MCKTNENNEILNIPSKKNKHLLYHQRNPRSLLPSEPSYQGVTKTSLHQASHQNERHQACPASFSESLEHQQRMTTLIVNKAISQNKSTTQTCLIINEGSVRTEEAFAELNSIESLRIWLILLVELQYLIFLSHPFVTEKPPLQCSLISTPE